jgi:CRISPR-associated exonuclease Cas4
MNITGTHMNYYHVCLRKLWLFHHNVRMEQHSELVGMGRLIHETSYPNRTSRYEEIELEGVKIDFYDPQKREVHEIKKTGSYEEAHAWQLKYYLLVLEKHGIEGATGVLEYPVSRERKQIVLEDNDKAHLKWIQQEIVGITAKDDCPGIQKSKSCKSCAYHDFCFVNEDLNN